MKIGITTIAYNQQESLKKLAETAIEWTDHKVDLHIFQHSRIKAVLDICDDILTLYLRRKHNAVLHYYGLNRGVSTSWNDGLIAMRNGDCDVWLIMNDDVWFTEGDIDKIASAAAEHREAYAIFCSGFHIGYDVPINCHGMSCFAMQPIAVDMVGFYDENFFPAYNEDVDYSKRAARAGLRPFIVPDTNIHHIGSAAIQTSTLLGQQNYITHGANNQYWTNKWGCPVTENPNDGYSHPFNNPKFHPYFIGEKIRHAPYRPFNRTDRYLVKI